VLLFSKFNTRFNIIRLTGDLQSVNMQLLVAECLQCNKTATLYKLAKDMLERTSPNRVNPCTTPQDVNLTSSVVSRLLRARRRLIRTIPRVVSRQVLPWLPSPLTTALPAVLFALMLLFCVTLFVQHYHTGELPLSSRSWLHGRSIHRTPRSAVDNQSNNNADGIHTKLLGTTESTVTSGYLEVVSSNSTFSTTSWPPSNTTHIEFRSYGGDAIDLRVLLLAYNRPDSLKECLEAINAAEYDTEDRVSLHVWIDGQRSIGSEDNVEDEVSHAQTIDVAETFNFSRGAYRVHIRSTHVGVQGQWMTVWRPSVSDQGHREVALIIEDDVTVSPFYWRWLRAAHRAYGDRDDVSGFSVSHPEMQHATGSTLEVPVNYTVFMYPVSRENCRC